MALPTFDDSWHRVAALRLRLRVGVETRKQQFRGEHWYVLHDVFSNQFYRLRPAAYRFVARLRPERTLEEVWEESLESEGDEAPGQGEVIHILGQLYQSNLLQADIPGDCRTLFERQKKRRQRELRGKLASLMFLRIPLWNPDHFLKQTLPMVRWLFGAVGILLWLAMISWGLVSLANHWTAFADQSQSLLSRGNLPLLYAGIVIAKVLHEFGHAYACRHFGGQVPVMGIMLLIFTPMPYMDATASWAFPERWKRITVASAGILAELFVAAIALVAWANTGGGALHNLAYNLVFSTAVATFLFNINPLLRFDGYYILSDLLEIPNLHKTSSEMMRYLLDRYAFGVRGTRPPTRRRRERAWLVVFFIASTIYKTLLFIGITLFVAGQFLVVGLIFAVVGAITWGVKPLYKALVYLFTEPRLARNRTRALLVGLGVPAVALILLGTIPFFHFDRAHGIVQAEEYSDVFTQAEGRLMEIRVPSGSRVEKGEVLLRFHSRELDLELRAEKARLEEAGVRSRMAEEDDISGLPYLESWREAVAMNLADLEKRKKDLTLRAPHDGVWIAPHLTELRSIWMARGTQVGRVINPSDFYFSAVVDQARSRHLFESGVLRAEVRLRSETGKTLPVEALSLIPANQQQLPSAALGIMGGGEMEVSADDGSGTRSVVPFFEIRARLPESEAAGLIHGVSGQVRLRLEDEPLLSQWARAVHQVIQKSFRL